MTKYSKFVNSVTMIRAIQIHCHNSELVLASLQTIGTSFRESTTFFQRRTLETLTHVSIGEGRMKEPKKGWKGREEESPCTGAQSGGQATKRNGGTNFREVATD